MQTLEFRHVIPAPVAKVWDTMLDEDTYTQWTAPFTVGHEKRVAVPIGFGPPVRTKGGASSTVGSFLPKTSLRTPRKYEPTIRACSSLSCRSSARSQNARAAW